MERADPPMALYIIQALLGIAVGAVQPTQIKRITIVGGSSLRMRMHIIYSAVLKVLSVIRERAYKL